ncbi:MAG: methylmalonyl Co-A mutase-associated GTPase MeaB [Micropruina glycogenica]|jgi:LAO/AO transport system kinase|uniref:Membrane ATPase/protein kinase n=1 Tax=Micropruina glycogenica TaxID=75385 RepID=A0A2N9JIB9_9ACTN|nr:methylmalonyl Co-A mutase-associated GTPase MeaB [Micropruina glycogenica]MCB0891755.1 methylmalonyl Co-A mutase-associated GTPase MeaB [Propionibacteriaceae bacterium]SPD87271.1 membrane ATPase/protein kinase [Micropruina glycogenica]
MRRLKPAELAEQVMAGSRPHIARAITLVESSRADHREQTKTLLRLLRPASGQSVRVGITGVPGAGKSTFIDALGVRLIEAGHRVAVLAVDPSSSRTGGSILGDRTRMAALTQSEDAYVRPSPSGGHLGGVARATRESMIVMEAAGFDVVLVETVGVGQSEVAVAGMVDTFLLITLARAGDQLQGIKRGILEMADVITVNKADGEHEGEARVTARELSIAMKLITSDPNARRPPVLTSSSLTGKGLDEVWQAVLDHRAYLEQHGGLEPRRARQQIEWLWSLVEGEVLDAVHNSPRVRSQRAGIEAEIAANELSALEGADDLVRAFVTDVPVLWPPRPLTGLDTTG